MEASDPAPWFERMLAEQGNELWVGDAAAIRASVVRKQKTDSHDEVHILVLLLTDRFPRVWIPSAAEPSAASRVQMNDPLRGSPLTLLPAQNAIPVS